MKGKSALTDSPLAQSRVFAATAAFLLLAGCGGESPVPRPAGPKPSATAAVRASDLKLDRRGRAYVHSPSGCWFRLPADWTHAAPQTDQGISVLQLTKPLDKITVTLSWSPLKSTLVEVVADELKAFRQRHGESNVGLLARVAAGKHVGWSVPLSADADGDVSRHGRVYWFETAAADGSRWKVKLRASYPRETDVAEVDGLLSSIDWTETDYGPPER